MVYTVTFNPALDYVVGVKDFQPGGLNRTAYETIQFGGKGINVSTVLHNLGIENTALGFLAGFTGRALDEGLRASGLRTDFIWLEEGLTRINVKIKAEEEGEINGRGPAIPDAAVGELFRKLDRLTAGDALVLAGSIPDSLPDDIYQQVLRRLEGKGVLTAVDASRDLLCATLPYRPFLIKPNVFELGEIFGRTLAGDREIRTCAQALQKRGACWSPWPGTGPCCWMKPASAAAWASRRVRCATPWARGTPWLPDSWPDGSRTVHMTPPIAWARRRGPLPRSVTAWREKTRFCPCSTANFNQKFPVS